MIASLQTCVSSVSPLLYVLGDLKNSEEKKKLISVLDISSSVWQNTQVGSRHEKLKMFTVSDATTPKSSLEGQGTDFSGSGGRREPSERKELPCTDVEIGAGVTICLQFIEGQ